MLAAMKSVDLLIVGAGFGGLYMLHKARALGLDALVIEAAPSVGGTWYHNRYPGARVDIQSMEYSYSFDEALQQEWQWSERYAPQPELLRYANHVADRFGLRDGIALNTRMHGAHFDEATKRWQVHADDGRQWSARFLVMASGPLSSPNRPDFPGLHDFKGPVLHTADWPHEPVDFSGQRVAVVGTGSSAVQAIPMIAQQAKELTVFQRTAAYAAPAHNGPLDPEFEARIKADYAGFRARNRRMHGGFGALLPPNPVSALAVSAEEREARLRGALADRRLRDPGRLQRPAAQPAVQRAAGRVRARQDPRDGARTRTPPSCCRPRTPSAASGCAWTAATTTPSTGPNVRLVDVSHAPIEALHRPRAAQRRARPSSSTPWCWPPASTR